MNLVYLLQRNASLDAQGRQFVQLMDEELKRMRYLISQTLGRQRVVASPTAVPLPAVLDSVLGFCSHKIASKKILVETRHESACVVKGHAEDLRQVFSNLVLNAVEALRYEGKLIVRAYRSRNWANEAQRGVRVVIADSGVGIATKYRGKVFRQSFTTKGNSGTGLGLPISADIVQQHGGSLRFRSSTMRGRSGSVFSVFLPEMPADEQASEGSDENVRLMAPLPENTRDTRRPGSDTGNQKHTDLLKIAAENKRLLAAILEQCKRYNELKEKIMSRAMA
ncbi:MAG TPA: HAMP domain-containing sensor histidine kinase [Terriglobales bacterium]|nr:HAMP domain-containing sensor histidine kinase [Terriglobales bacterium]